MITGKYVVVEPGFDSGTYLDYFNIATFEKGKYMVENLQTKFNLSFKDFDILSIFICSVVDKFIEEKIKQEMKKEIK